MNPYLKATGFKSNTSTDSYLSNQNVNTNSSIIIHPNPSNDYINVSFKTETHQTLNYHIYALSGKLLKVGDIVKGDRIDIAHLAIGVYIIKLFDAEFSYHEKIMKY